MRLECSHSTGYAPKWIISNRESIGCSDASAGARPEIADFVGGLQESAGSDVTICVLSQKLLLSKAYHQQVGPTKAH